MKQRGFTLIEMMILAVIATVILTIAAPALFGFSTSSSNNITWGVNGMTESRCIENYKFIVGQDGNTRQILDEFGKGVKCENPNAGKPGAFGKM
jgi:prepilin-type N-terminal cleavage/methylation domain-containing protein